MDPSASRAALLRFIEADPALASFLALARERLAGDPGHDVQHALRVALWTLRLSRGEAPPRLAVAAALLHDIRNVPKDSPDRARASELAAADAAALLREAGFPEAEVGLAADAVRDHSFSRGAVPTGALGRALQDADRLDALGALGVMRTVSTGVRMGAGYFHPDDPFGEARELDDRRWSVDHFFRKLLRLPETMRTEAGRAEARRRAEVLERFLDDLAQEIGVPRPAAPAAPAGPTGPGHGAGVGVGEPPGAGPKGRPSPRPE
jgi:uncharacterized protein